MKPCPVCARPVAGHTQRHRIDGFVIHAADATYLVHNACLSNFIARLKASTSTWALDALG